MSKCKNLNLGNLLHAYELKALSDEDVEHFEIHLLECEFCFEQLRNFERVASLLASDEEVKKSIRDSLQQEQPHPEPFLKKLWRSIWPDAPIVFKPAMAYLIILVMIIPAYLGVTKLVRNENKSIQVVYLASDRSAGGDVFQIRPKSRFQIGFEFDGARVGQAYKLVVESSDHKVVLKNYKYKDFNEKGCGYLDLPVSKMKAGNYRLVITDPQTGNWQEYTFRVKQ